MPAAAVAAEAIFSFLVLFCARHAIKNSTNLIFNVNEMMEWHHNLLLMKKHFFCYIWTAYDYVLSVCNHTFVQINNEMRSIYARFIYPKAQPIRNLLDYFIANIHYFIRTPRPICKNCALDDNVREQSVRERRKVEVTAWIAHITRRQTHNAK